MWYYLKFSQTASAALRKFQDERRWLDWLDLDLENIRTALTDWLRQGQAETALECLMALRNYWIETGRAHEARRWFAQALTPQGQVTSLKLEQALGIDGELAMVMHLYDEAKSQLLASLALTQARGLRAPLRLLHLGSVEHSLGDLGAARRYFEQALIEFHAAGTLPGVAASLNSLGVVLTEAGDFTGALEQYEEALQAKRASGNDIETVLIPLGDLHRRLGNLEASRTSYLDALRGVIERRAYLLVPDTLEGLGRLACDMGHPRRAAILIGAAAAQRDSLKMVLTTKERTQIDWELSPVRTALGETEFSSALMEGRALTLEQAAALAVTTQTPQ